MFLVVCVQERQKDKQTSDEHRVGVKNEGVLLFLIFLWDFSRRVPGSGQTERKLLS